MLMLLRFIKPEIKIFYDLKIENKVFQQFLKMK